MVKTVTDYLEKTADRLPEKIAFCDEKREITFGEIRDESKKAASVIAEKNIFNKPICILMEKSVECINAMLSIVYSGNFYTVLDVDMPEARIQKILEVLSPVAIITNEAHLSAAKDIVANANSLSEDSIIVYEDAIKTEIAEEKLLQIREEIDVNSTMFVLFTSGSTGVPKGVIIPHRAFPPYINWYADTFHFDETTIFANQAPFYFIMSCPDIFLTILTGATCHIVPKKAFSFPMVTLNYLKERHVNVLYWVPSVLCMIANFRALPEVHLDDLKHVMFGGEVMPSKQMNMWRKEYPNVQFTNLYGPTETTEMISYYVIDREVSDTESLPIGIPASYIKVILLDENDKEVAPGEIGELCAAGISIADGYYNMPEKTKEVFVKNPVFKEGDDPESIRMYRTGDLAKIDENGDLIYMGRKDFQIKHMGNRIELGEIETAVSALSGIDQNCCLYDTKRSRIVLFYTGTATEDYINEELRNALPVYMIPNRIEKLEKMPFNINGKIDRAALKEQI